MEWCLLSGRHWRDAEEVRDSGRGNKLYKLRWGQTMVMPKCQEEKPELICEQCLTGVGQSCDERAKSIAQGRVEEELQAVRHLEMMAVDKVFSDDVCAIMIQ